MKNNNFISLGEFSINLTNSTTLETISNITDCFELAFFCVLAGFLVASMCVIVTMALFLAEVASDTSNTSTSSKSVIDTGHDGANNDSDRKDAEKKELERKLNLIVKFIGVVSVAFIVVVLVTYMLDDGIPPYPYPPTAPAPDPALKELMYDTTIMRVPAIIYPLKNYPVGMQYPIGAQYYPKGLIVPAGTDYPAGVKVPVIKVDRIPVLMDFAHFTPGPTNLHHEFKAAYRITVEEQGYKSIVGETAEEIRIRDDFLDNMPSPILLQRQRDGTPLLLPYDKDLDELLTCLPKMGALTSKPYTFRARPWELTDLIMRDPFSVLLNLVRFNLRGSEILRVLPASNNSGWISNKSRFAYDGFTRQRISEVVTFSGSVSSLVKKESFLTAELAQSTNVFSNIIAGANLAAADFLKLSQLASNLNSNLSLEFKYSENDFRSDFVANDSVSPLVLFLDLDPKLYFPMLNLSFKKRAGFSNFFSIGYVGYNSYQIENLGSNLSTFSDILEGKHPFCKLILQHKSLQIFYDPTRFSTYVRNISSIVLGKFNIVCTPVSLYAGLVTQLEIGSPAISNFNFMSNNTAFTTYSSFFTDDFITALSNYPYFSFYLGSHVSRSHLSTDFSNRPMLSFPLEASLEKSEFFYDIFGKSGTTSVILSSIFQDIRSLGNTVLSVYPLWLYSQVIYDYSLNYGRYSNLARKLAELTAAFSFGKSGLITFIKDISIGFTSKPLFVASVISAQSVYLRPSLDVYFFTDVITRSSKLMALSAKRYYDKANNYFI